ncbi:MAG: ISAs1 family transposase [Flavobacteriaceae bacterium]|nr:ISAs1 family transposase [Flavobacteriaceae bacterium]
MILELLNILSLKHTVVTIDAMGCQKEIALVIVKENTDYILTVKESQKQLHQDIKDEFRFGKTITFFISQDLHGRIETRTCSVLNNLKYIDPSNKW